MEYQKTPTQPLSRGLTALLVLVMLAAFLPHRERALLQTRDGFGPLLASQSLDRIGFIGPARWGLFSGNRWEWDPAGSLPNSLRRDRNAPGRQRYADALPNTLPATSFGSTVPTVIPLGSGVPQGAPVLASAAPVPGGAVGGPGAIGSFPGGGGGGGGSISGPVDPIVPPIDLPPPVGVVPEPATWAFMILGFGLIGSALRRSRRRAPVAA